MFSFDARLEDEKRDCNLVGMRPHLTAEDYVSAQRFADKLDSCFAEALRLGWLGERTVVVLPELIGAWLLADGGFYRLPSTIKHVMALLALTSPLRFGSALFRATGPSRLLDAMFRMNAERVVRVYHEVFSALAANYRVTLVAGSVILPEPRVAKGRLVTGQGPLRNTAVVYRPDGLPHDRLVRKVHPIEMELGFVAPAALEDLPVLKTPAGKLGVLICADSWFPACYEFLLEGGMELLAVPAFLTPEGSWGRVWPGYSGEANPDDVRPADPGKISEGEAWMRYAMPGRLRAPAIPRSSDGGSEIGSPLGITVFMGGGPWDLGTDGTMLGATGEEVTVCPGSRGSSLMTVGWKRAA